MKTLFPGQQASPTPASGRLPASARDPLEIGTAFDPVAEGGTRAAIIRLLLESPTTAVEIADRLGITPAGVRRHLDALVDEGAVTSRDNCSHRPRGRGRPPREYLLTDAGRSRLPHSYDELAADALRFVAEVGGDEAVLAFARRRAEALIADHRAELAAAPDASTKVEILSRALTEKGFSASAAEVGNAQQLCQHHCPVAHVAAQFPQLCHAELDVFAEAIGSYAQRLATIARGDSFCTTFVPGSVDHAAGSALASSATPASSVTASPAVAKPAPSISEPPAASDRAVAEPTGRNPL